jgi:hypothetical protein
MLRDTSITAGWVTNERQITVSFRSVQQFPAENARDVYGLIWQALSKDEGFDAVDRIVVVVRGAGPRPYEVNCPSKVVQESGGYMSEELMARGCTLDGGNHAALEFRQIRVSQMNRLYPALSKHNTGQGCGAALVPRLNRPIVTCQDWAIRSKVTKSSTGE